MKITNLVSLFRVAALPIIITLIYKETASAFLWAIIVLLLAIVSDFLDGYLARKLNEKTVVGSFLDPFADKILVIGLLFTFVFRGEFSLWILLFFILRDLIVLVIRWFASYYNVQVFEQWHSHVMITSQLGIVLFILINKYFVLKTVVYDIFYAFSELLIVVVTGLSVLLALTSIVYYIAAYFNEVKSVKKIGKKVQKENLVILANKKARGYQNNYRKNLLNVFSKRRNAKIVFLPENQKNMYAGIEKKIIKYSQVMIAGGDGSFEGALNYKPLQKKSLGFFPLGAGNAYYSYFYRGNRFEYLRSRFDFHEMNLDVLEVEWEKGKTLTGFLAIGVDAEVIRLSQNRTAHGLSDYVKASIKALLTVRANYDLDCTIDGKKKKLENCANITVAKIPYHGFSIRSLLGKVDPNNGLVYGLAVVNTHSQFLNKITRAWSLFLVALNLDKHPLVKITGKKIEIKSDVPFPIQAGGEFLGYTSWVKIKVGRKQKVLVI